MTTKPVVVGVDGSEESLQAVEWAALEARRHSSPLHIVSAPASVPRIHAYNASPTTIPNALRGISARALDAAITRCEEVAPGLPYRPACCPDRRPWPWPKAAQAPPCSSSAPGEQADSRRWSSAR
jgi:hypothetical protein